MVKKKNYDVTNRFVSPNRFDTVKSSKAKSPYDYGFDNTKQDNTTNNDKSFKQQPNNF